MPVTQITGLARNGLSMGPRRVDGLAQPSVIAQSKKAYFLGAFPGGLFDHRQMFMRDTGGYSFGEEILARASGTGDSPVRSPGVGTCDPPDQLPFTRTADIAS